MGDDQLDKAITASERATAAAEEALQQRDAYRADAERWRTRALFWEAEADMKRRECIHLAAQRNEARGALDAMALARDEAIDRRNEATSHRVAELEAEVERLRRSIPLGELRQVTYVTRMATPSELTDQLDAALARVAALEAVLAEPSDPEEMLRLMLLIADHTHVESRGAVRAILAHLRQRAGTPTPRPALTRAEVEAAMGLANIERVREAVCDLIEAGPETTPEVEDRLIVEVVCAVLGIEPVTAPVTTPASSTDEPG